jgi:NitT/TauT family transport system substrate-binding protein
LAAYRAYAVRHSFRRDSQADTVDGVAIDLKEGNSEYSVERESIMSMIQNRRRFLATLSSAGAAGLMSAPASFAQEAPPETTTIKLAKHPGICVAPQYVAGELLRAEGFTDIRYADRPPAVLSAAIGRGEVDLSLHFVGPLITAIDSGERITMVAGIHVGCFELFAHEGIRGIRDLKGKRVGIQGPGVAAQVFLSSMAAYVGLDPVKDIDWVTSPLVSPMELFADGKIDAFLGFPPETQELRARKIGKVIVNSSIDRPWSQNFCCMLAGNREYVRKNPVATKRALRAILKATDFCVSDPAGAARRMVDGGFTARYDYAYQTLKEVSYGQWREYDPEDTIRFYSLRLHQAGMIKTNPNKILADATNWRFVNEVRRELKS